MPLLERGAERRNVCANLSLRESRRLRPGAVEARQREFQRGAATKRISDEVGLLDPQGVHEVADGLGVEGPHPALDDGLVGTAVAGLVDEQDAELLGQRLQVLLPVAPGNSGDIYSYPFISLLIK